MPDFDHAAILERLRAHLPLVGQNATSLARLLGLSDDAVSVWFARGKFPLDHAPAVATALARSPAWLLFGEEPLGPSIAEEVSRLAARQEEIASRLEELVAVTGQLLHALGQRLSDPSTPAEG